MKRVLAGTQAAREALRAEPGRVQVVYVSHAERADPAIVAMAQRSHVPIERLTQSEIDALARGLKHQGVLVITGEYPYRSVQELLEGPRDSHLLVICDQIEDPQNLGAIARSAVCFGATGIVIGKDRSAPVSAGAVRASAGATEHARIARTSNIAQAIVDLSARDIRTVGLDAQARVALGSVDLRGPIALVIGSEAKGLRRLVRERCDVLARIPMAGPLGSLNASVACAVALYEAHVQRNPADRAPPWEEP